MITMNKAFFVPMAVSWEKVILALFGVLWFVDTL